MRFFWHPPRTGTLEPRVCTSVDSIQGSVTCALLSFPLSPLSVYTPFLSSIMSPPTAPSTLRALASLISDSVDILDHAYTQRGLSFPSLDHPTTQLTDHELKLAQDTNVSRACATICAAANQLIYSVRDPKATALFAASSVSLSFPFILKE